MTRKKSEEPVNEPRPQPAIIYTNPVTINVDGLGECTFDPATLMYRIGSGEVIAASGMDCERLLAALLLGNFRDGFGFDAQTNPNGWSVEGIIMFCRYHYQAKKLCFDDQQRGYLIVPSRPEGTYIADNFWSLTEALSKQAASLFLRLVVEPQKNGPWDNPVLSREVVEYLLNGSTEVATITAELQVKGFVRFASDGTAILINHGRFVPLTEPAP